MKKHEILSPQSRAALFDPLIIIDAEKFANKNDVGSNGDEIGNRLPCKNGAPLSRSAVCLVLPFMARSSSAV